MQIVKGEIWGGGGEVYNWVRKEVKGDCRQYSGLRGGRGGFKARMILKLPEWEGDYMS